MKYRIKRSDELYHYAPKGEQKNNHKYIRREWKNNRWVYYYENNDPERNREQQNMMYDTTDKLAGRTFKYTVQKIKPQRITKDNMAEELSKHRKLVSAGKMYIATKLSTKILKRLNNIGDGTLDDKVINVAAKVGGAINKGRRFLKNLFG